MPDQLTLGTPQDLGIHTALQRAYDHFNAELFGGKLPPCVLLVHRKRGARGYFWNGQWAARTADGALDPDNGRHEIAMNPESFTGRGTDDIMSTLVHEMVHLRQHEEGKPNRGGHNREWATMMKEIGLLPYARGHMPTLIDGVWSKPDKDTGKHCSHVIEPDGLFAQSCARLLAAGVEISWTLAPPAPAAAALAKVKRASKTKVNCEGCGLNAWAKPDALIGCWDCGILMTEPET